jgi:glutamate synthase (NADPH/NADH) large chain
MPADVAIRHVERQDHHLDEALDHALIAAAGPALESGKAVRIQQTARNQNRSIGAMLSGEVAKRYGHAGLPPDTIHVTLNGTAGQSFGAWAARGVTLELIGEGNDYVGKGLSGGRLIVKPAAASRLVPADNIIVGNTVLYGAITGEAYFSGVAGERFAVRNSGAMAVVEGVGDHGCEYMTGGVVAVLGNTGRNFAAGMSGGVAYVYDADGTFEQKLNRQMVQIEDLADADCEECDEDGIADHLRFDVARLRLMVRRHFEYTGSARAKHILDHWSECLPKFRKVMPADYRRALGELRRRQMADVAQAAAE